MQTLLEKSSKCMSELWNFFDFCCFPFLQECLPTILKFTWSIISGIVDISKLLTRQCFRVNSTWRVLNSFNYRSIYIHPGWTRANKVECPEEKMTMKFHFFCCLCEFWPFFHVKNSWIIVRVERKRKQEKRAQNYILKFLSFQLSTAQQDSIHQQQRNLTWKIPST